MLALNMVAIFVVSLFFSVVISTLWVRLAVRYLRISTVQPVSQLVYTLTNPLVNPIQQLSKYQYKAGQKYDLPVFIILISFEVLKILCLSLLMLHAFMPFRLFLLYILADLVIQPCNILFLAILIRVIMNFINPDWHGATADFLRFLTDPLLKLGRKLVPVISGFDFSPFLILISLKIITLFISSSLPWRIL